MGEAVLTDSTGSQTGQAEAIAERIRDLAREKGFDPDMYCISQSEKKVVRAKCLCTTGKE